MYQNLVHATLRVLIEDVGGVEGVYDADVALPDNFPARRTVGNAIDALGIVALRVSPVWVLAALADLSGMGRQLIPEIAAALKAQGLLDKGAQFTSVDQMLDGLERTSSRLASTINTPPLDVAGLRSEWNALRNEARQLQPASLPTWEAISAVWAQLKTEAARQERSIFETSSMMAVSAARISAVRTGRFFASALLDHYRQTLSELREAGYWTYASQQLKPYVHAAIGQFSPKRRTVTERVVDKLQSLRSTKRIGALVFLSMMLAPTVD